MTMEKVYKISVMMTVFVCAYFMACGQTLERGNYELKGSLQTIQTAETTIKIDYNNKIVTENFKQFPVKDSYTEASKNVTVVKYDNTVLYIYFSKSGKYIAHKFFRDNILITSRN